MILVDDVMRLESGWGVVEVGVKVDVDEKRLAIGCGIIGRGGTIVFNVVFVLVTLEIVIGGFVGTELIEVVMSLAVDVVTGMTFAKLVGVVVVELTRG